MNEDDVFGYSAGLAYYFFLSIWPGLFFLTSLLGVLATGTDLQGKLMSYLGGVLPPATSQLVQTTLQQIVQSHSGTKLWLGLIFAWWTASGGMSTISQTLDITYDVSERRPYWKQKLNALWLTLAVVALLVAALVLITYGPMIADAIFGGIGGSSVVAWVWKIVQWPVAVLFVFLAFSLMYKFAPDVYQKWAWISPGAVVGVFLWLVASFGFRVYLHFFNSYSMTYGALGTVIIMLVWLYISGAAILIGSEINAEIEHAAARRGHPEAREPREKQAA